MLRVFFGSPGAGKTTLICKLLKQNRKYYDYCFCNFPLNPRYSSLLVDHSVSSIQLKELGKWTFPEHSYIALDEAGIEYNNRAYKSLPQYSIEWYKLHRHYKCDVDVFSQSWEDMDITLRRLASELWYIRKIGPFTLQRKVYRFVTVDKESHQIIDGYRMEKGLWILLQPLRLFGLAAVFPQLKGWKMCYRPKYYKYFDSWQHPDLPLLAIPGDGPLPATVAG